MPGLQGSAAYVNPVRSGLAWAGIRTVEARVFGAPAEMFAKNYKACGGQSDTSANVDCTAAKTKIWDRRLNAAYLHLAQVADPGQRDPLKAAQRLRIQ